MTVLAGARNGPSGLQFEGVNRHLFFKHVSPFTTLKDTALATQQGLID